MAEGLAPRKLSWEVCDAHAKATGHKLGLGAGNLGPMGGGRSKFWLGGATGRKLWEQVAGLLPKPVPSTQGAWPSGSSEGFYTLCLSWHEVGVGLLVP